MTEDTSTEPQQAVRVARAIGVPLATEPPQEGRALLLIDDLGDRAREYASRSGSLMFLPGWEKPKIGEIVVPLDGTATAEVVIPFVMQLSQAEVAEILIMVRAGGTYTPLEMPVEKYINVLVGTLREQKYRVRGEIVQGDLLSAAGKAAETHQGLVAVAAKSGEKINEDVFKEDTPKRLQGAPLLLVSPV